MVLKGDLGKVKTGSGFASYVWVPSIEEQIESLFWIDVVFVMVTIKQKTYCGQCPARFTLEPWTVPPLWGHDGPKAFLGSWTILVPSFRPCTVFSSNLQPCMAGDPLACHVCILVGKAQARAVWSSWISLRHSLNSFCSYSSLAAFWTFQASMVLSAVSTYAFFALYSLIIYHI